MLHTKTVHGFKKAFPKAVRVSRKVTRLQQSMFNLPIQQCAAVKVAASRHLCAECFAPLPLDEAPFHKACMPAGVLFLHGFCCDYCGEETSQDPCTHCGNNGSNNRSGGPR
jgi:hypothetical protein